MLSVSEPGPAASGLPSATLSAPIVHTLAAAQPANGARIASLSRIGDRVFVAYGDYGANTGPIYPGYFNRLSPQDGLTISSTPADSHALEVYRALPGLGGIATPHTDGIGGSEGYALLPDGSSVWNDRPTVLVDGLHAFDMIEFDGAAYIAGSADFQFPQGNSALWRLDYANPGAGWVREPIGGGPVGGGTSDSSRFNWLAIIDGYLVANKRTLAGSNASTFRLAPGSRQWKQYIASATSQMSGQQGGAGVPFRDGWIITSSGVGSSTNRLFFLRSIPRPDVALVRDLEVTPLAPILGAGNPNFPGFPGAVSGWDVSDAGDLWVHIGGRLVRVPAAGPLLGTNVSKIELPNGKSATSLSSIAPTRFAVGTATGEIYIATLP